MIAKDVVLKAALGEYNNSYPYWNGQERAAGRASVRGLMARLGLYDDFVKVLDQQPDVVGYRTDGTAISAYAPGGGPLPDPAK